MRESKTDVDVRLLFDDLCLHLRERADFVRSLAVMGAMERWVQFEVAALADIRRDRYGMGGGDRGTPDWWVTVERQRVDLWLQCFREGASQGVAIELKAIHNNKNFWDKIWSIRHDMRETRPVPEVECLERWAILVVVYAQFVEGHEGGYQILGRDGDLVSWDAFHGLLHSKLAEPWQEDNDYPALDIVKRTEITSLDDARYIEPGKGTRVHLALCKHAAAEPAV